MLVVKGKLFINVDLHVPLTICLRKSRKLPTEELANESRSTHITVAADMVFSLSHYLNGVRVNVLITT